MGYWKSHLQFPILFTLSTIYISINYLISVDYFGLDPGLADKYKKKQKSFHVPKRPVVTKVHRVIGITSTCAGVNGASCNRLSNF